MPKVSVRWPDDGQKRPKHVAIKKRKLVTKCTVVVFDGNYKQFLCSIDYYYKQFVYLLDYETQRAVLHKNYVV